MQNILALIEQLLTDWYQLTIENPIYAGALIITVWLLAVIYYSIRIYLLNKRQRVTEKGAIEVQGQLDDAQQQVKLSEEKVTGLAEKLVNEQQISAECAAKVDTRNQQVVENIKQLADKFGLSEQLIASNDKPATEFVWQQQDNIQMQLAEQLHAERKAISALQESSLQDKEQFRKQDAVIQQLKKTLELQTGKSALLENDLKELKYAQQAQENEAELKLAKALSELQEKHALDIAELANELNQQKDASVNVTREHLSTEAAEAAEIAEIAEDSLSQNGTLLNLHRLAAAETIAQSQSPVENQGDQLEALDDVKMSDPVLAEGDFEQQADSADAFIEEPKGVELSENLTQLEVELEESGSAPDPDYSEPNLDITEKFKSLFAKNKTLEKAEPEQPADVTSVAAIESEVMPVEGGLAPDYSKSGLNISGKFKGFFSKDKEPQEKTESAQSVEVTPVAAIESEAPAPVEESLAPDYSGESNLDIGGKFKSLFSKDKKPQEKTGPAQSVEVAPAAAIELESSPVEESLAPDYSESNLDIGGKFKSLFSKDKKPQEKTEPAQSVEVAPVAAIEPESASVEESLAPDYSESNLNIGGKFKGLFAKNKKPLDRVEPERAGDIIAAAVTESPVEPGQQEEAITSVALEAEEPEYEVDYTKSNLNLSTRVKKLFGKS